MAIQAGRVGYEAVSPQADLIPVERRQRRTLEQVSAKIQAVEFYRSFLTMIGGFVLFAYADDLGKHGALEPDQLRLGAFVMIIGSFIYMFHTVATTGAQSAQAPPREMLEV